MTVDYLKYTFEITTYDHGHIRGLRVMWVETGKIILEVGSNDGAANMAFLADRLGETIMRELIEAEAKYRAEQ